MLSKYSMIILYYIFISNIIFLIFLENIFLNDHLVFEEDHGVEEEGSKDRDDANEGPQLQGGHG